MQFKLAVSLTRQRHGHDRHIIHIFRLHEKGLGSRRQKIPVRHQLVVQIDQALLHRLADIEAHDDQRAAGARDRIDVLHAFDLGKFAFEGFGQLLFDDLGGSAGKGQPHVGHRNDDLRFFFARGDDDGKQAQQQRRQHNQGRQLAPDKQRGNPARQTVMNSVIRHTSFAGITWWKVPLRERVFG